MKKVKLYVPEKMKQEIDFLKEQGIDIDEIMQESVENMITDFKENPEEFLKTFKDIENRFQAEYKIN